jgi:hypothetical protein
MIKLPIGSFTLFRILYIRFHESFLYLHLNRFNEWCLISDFISCSVHSFPIHANQFPEVSEYTKKMWELIVLSYLQALSHCLETDISITPFVNKNNSYYPYYLEYCKNSEKV